MSELHPLLKRQLKRLGLDPADAPQPPWAELLARVSRAYEEHDQERRLLEHSQDLASREMAALYATVRADRDTLERRVDERTEALRVSEARLSSLLSLSADWIWEQDAELRFTYLSEGIASAVGLAPADMIGRRREFDDRYHAEPEARAAYEACLAARRAFRDFDFRLVRADGVTRYIRISGEPVFDEAGCFRGYRGVGRDITATAVAELKVQELARFDSLTGLPNRSMFLGELDRAIARADRRGDGFAVCFIDLDRFKSINDTLGHASGDELLKVMARRLRGVLRETDLVARLGGDEFVVMLDGDAEPGTRAAVARKLLDAIGEPLSLSGVAVQVSGSIGIACHPLDGDDAATLLKHADAAMYLAKARGKANIQFYTAELAEEATRAFEIESELRLALVRSELLLHYQPKIDLASGAMCSVEALLRWRHPERGMVSPGDFIPLAEERGLIVPIGRWVVQAACRQIRDWRSAGLQPVPVAVNLSARQFASDSLVSDITDAMRLYGVAPHEIAFELTESALMAEPERANAVLHQLDAMGMAIAIDDFGTGYSSLSYLKRFPARQVKIDRSFVKGLPGDRDDAAITQAVIAMAHSLGLGVVAEGVETDAQLQALRAMGCDEAQGYLLGRPMPAADLAGRLSPASGQLDAA
ncbi:MAG: putative bifunctional diguanylate cyclase/phosphodiesterase [Aquabacterium sp.]